MVGSFSKKKKKERVGSRRGREEKEKQKGQLEVWKKQIRELIIQNRDKVSHKQHLLP